jgi:VWFA-related protein
MRRRACLLGLLLVSTATLPAQHQIGSEDPLVFRAATHLVTIDAVVTDGDGKPVTNLTRDDFEVTVGGKPQLLAQAVYIRTQEQPQAWAAARAAATAGARNAPSDPRSASAASRTLRTTGTTPDSIARTIALVVDDLGLSFRGVHDVRDAVHKYIDTQIEPGDLVAIIRTAGGVGALQQFTTDRRLLHLAADRLLWNVRSHGAFASPDGAGLDEVDQLHDTLASVGSMGALEYIARGVSQLPGRKCIIYFSEGSQSLFSDRMGSGSSRGAGSERIWRAMTRMLSRANAAGVVIYTVDARGLMTGSAVPAADTGSAGGSGSGGGGLEAGASLDPRAVRGDGGFLDTPSSAMGAADRRRPISDSQESLRFLADQTGGLPIENTNDLNLGIKRILDDQRGYYLLGYPAAEDSARGLWTQNRVKVRVKRPGLRVRARQGFFGPFDTSAQKVEAADPLVMSALSPFGSGAITVRLTSMFAYDAAAAKAGSYVRSLLFIDPGDLHFEVDPQGRHTARFQVLVLAVGDNGLVLDAWRREVPLALTDATFQQIQNHGIVVTVRSPAKEPGPYQMRAAVEDLSSKRVGSAAQFLEVPQVGGGHLAVSGVLLKGVTDSHSPQAEAAPKPDAPAGLADGVLLEPEVRVLSPGDNAVYAFEIYDGLKDDNPDLQMSTAVIRDGKVVYQSPFAPVAATPKSGGKLRAIPVAGTLALAPDMPDGPYTLEVTVRAGTARKGERKQWLDFEIRR